MYDNITNQPVTATLGVTCVDSRVFGQAGPAKPLAKPQATIQVKPVQ